MHETRRSRPRLVLVRPVLAVALLMGWLVAALLAPGSGGLLLAPFDPCGHGSGCAADTIFITEYAIRYGPLLLLFAVLPPAAARLLQHRAALPVVGVGAVAIVVLLAGAMLIAAIAG